MNKNIDNITCPSCRKVVKWNLKSRFRPFCSKRCQLIDLGEWIEERKHILIDT